MRKLLKKVFRMSGINEVTVKNGVTQHYCSLIQNGSTHDEAISEIKETMKFMMEEVEHIEGKTN